MRLRENGHSMCLTPMTGSCYRYAERPYGARHLGPRWDGAWIPMTLTDEEWRAFINEYDGAMTDVETDLAAALEGNRLLIESLALRGAIPSLDAEALYDTVRESLVRVQDRLNVHARRLRRMREASEL